MSANYSHRDAALNRLRIASNEIKQLGEFAATFHDEDQQPYVELANEVDRVREFFDEEGWEEVGPNLS